MKYCVDEVLTDDKVLLIQLENLIPTQPQMTNCLMLLRKQEIMTPLAFHSHITHYFIHFSERLPSHIEPTCYMIYFYAK